MTNSVETEEHDGKTDHATWGQPMSLGVLCAQPMLRPGIVGTTPHDVADRSIELLDDAFEVAITS